MLGFITKSEYFSWIDAFSGMRESYASASINNLKDIQDHYVISRLHSCEGLKILEIGGGDCRVLRSFSKANECWNAEKYEGLGLGPKRVITTPGVKNIFAYVGEFSGDLPSAFFDIVFSVSVVEHVVDEDLEAFFGDIARVLKPGGRTFHAIDMYVFDQNRWDEGSASYSRRRLQKYLSVPALSKNQLKFVEPPVVGDSPGFSCEYASNSDREMLAWNRVVPKLAPVRSIAQSVSLKAEWERV